MKYILCIVLMGIMLVSSLPTSAQVSETSEWTGTLKNGKTLTKEDLAKIIKDHEKWLSSDGQEGKMADLSGANLSGADLSGANLRGANLSEAKLIKANLSRANLSNANLSKADLSNALLVETQLVEAELDDAILVNANLGYADLNRADLEDADLNKANAMFTDFSKCNFQPKNVEELNFLGAKGFSSIVLFNNVKAAADLRNIAKEHGLRSEERALTSAVYQFRLKSESRLEQNLAYILLKIPSDYGATPWRSLWLLAGFIGAFSLFYMGVIMRQEKDKQGKDGIHKIWLPERVRTDLGAKKPIRLNLHGWAILWVGFYFSILSAFNVGWRNLNVGNWIARIQSREYIYRATGWTRTISGIQSLLSVYLLALWALTYFGRPFE
jgi:uncharacterized protein YjbI with pentapeptide repeats